MDSHFRTIAIKATIASVVSIGLSLAICFAAVTVLGGALNGTGLVMCILCPLLIAWPASAFQLWQNDRLKQAHAAIALINGRLEAAHGELKRVHAELKERAGKDGLTGILNRESFLDAVEARRCGQGGGLLLVVDVDHFKSVNDRFGHLAGDDALRSITAAINTVLFPHDIFGRIGGEEFGVFLVDADPGQAILRAERIRVAVAMLSVRVPGKAGIAITVSIGGAHDRGGEQLLDILKEADDRLYHAKRLGRNCAVIDSGIVEAA